MVEEPNPAMAPIASDINAIRKNSNNAYISYFFLCSVAHQKKCYLKNICSLLQYNMS
jgi:hypothetical protein